MEDRPGISETACEALNQDGTQPDDGDDVPVTITSVQILELNREDQPLSQETRDGVFVDGQEFNYTSVTVRNPDLDEAVGALQIALDGRNAQGAQIINSWIIKFTNECGIFPLLEADDQIGWTVFVSSTLPEAKFCPGM